MGTGAFQSMSSGCCAAHGRRLCCACAPQGGQLQTRSTPASGQSSVVLIILSSQGKVTRCISFFSLAGGTKAGRWAGGTGMRR